MPNRIIRESILTSRAINQLSIEAEIFYRRLISVVDDFGRFEADPDLLLARVYPLKISADTCGQWRLTADNCAQLLAECGQVLTTDGEPLVTVYEIERRKYLQINNFGQRTRSKSKYPEPPADTCCQLTADVSSCPPIARASSPSPSSDTTTNTSSSPDSVVDRFEEWWEKYPQKIGRNRAAQMWLSLVTVENVEEVFAGLERWLRSDRWARGIIHDPANWVSEKLWQDEPSPKVGVDDRVSVERVETPEQRAENVAELRKQWSSIPEHQQRVFQETYPELAEAS